MLIKLQNVTDIKADYEKIKQYIMDTGLTITRTARSMKRKCRFIPWNIKTVKCFKTEEKEIVPRLSK